MTVARDLPLNFRVGARTLVSLRRRLVRVALPLDAAMAGAMPPLPPLPEGADGYSILSLPVARAGGFASGLLVAERQRYRRYWTDLTVGWDVYQAGLSGNLRSSLKRKGRKLAGAGMRIERYRTPDELAAFHAIARPLAAETYQERLLAMGLPGDPDFVAEMLRRAAASEVCAWAMFVGDAPAAYLYCPVEGGTAVYEYVGHAERFDALSPGTVLMAEAIRDMMADEGLARFDFTEGEGQLKRQFATGYVECADMLLLRPTLANRVALGALAGWDGVVAAVKRRISPP